MSRHRHISSGNLNYSQTYYTCSTCGADIEDEDEELGVVEESQAVTKAFKKEYKCQKN